MSESIEQMKKRLEFLVNERQQKAAEFEQLRSQGKTTSVSAILHALSGDGSTSLLHQQQIIQRMQDINSQIRRLNFEIESLEAEIKKREEGRHCSLCGKDISQFPADAMHCPYCGSELKEASWVNVEQ